MLTYKNPKAKSCAVCERVFVPERDGESVCGPVCGLKNARASTSDGLTIELPWPDAKLNPNRSKGTHWGMAAAIRKDAKMNAYALTLEAMSADRLWKCSSEPSLTITFVQPDKRARDRDNLLAALKPALDGVAAALRIDDSQFEPITIRREYGAKPGCVRVEVRC